MSNVLMDALLAIARSPIDWRESEMHRNSVWLMDWGVRVGRKLWARGIRRDLCRDLAYHMGEEGNDSPSDAAITEAIRWEDAIERGEKPWEERDDAD